MDVFTGQQIEINGERYTVEGEPQHVSDEYRVTCTPERGAVNIIFTCPDLHVLRAAIVRFATLRKRSKSPYRPIQKPR
jgi:hypothetical protein